MSHINWLLIGAYASAVWAGVGPLIGVLVGGFLTSRIQRRHWLADNKKQEYRELLSVMAAAYGALLKVSRNFAWNDETKNIQVEVANVLRDRIFTSVEVARSDALKRWVRASETLQEGNVKEFRALGQQLLDDIRKAALKDINS
jgi:heme exporter protein D